MKGTRRGFSLLETLVVIAICSVVFSSVAVVLHRGMQLDRRWRAELALAQQLPQIGLQLRRDAHDARAVERPAGDATLWLQQPDGRRIGYRIEQGQLLRIEQKADGGQRTRRLLEQKDTELQWETPQEGLVRLVILRRLGEIQAADAIRRDVIDVAVGIRPSFAGRETTP